METITWSELITKAAKLWRIDACAFVCTKTGALNSALVLNSLYVTVDNESEYRVIRTPFTYVVVPNESIVNHLKQVLRKACEDQGPKCVTGFQNVEVADDGDG